MLRQEEQNHTQLLSRDATLGRIRGSRDLRRRNRRWWVEERIKIRNRRRRRSCWGLVWGTCKLQNATSFFLISLAQNTHTWHTDTPTKLAHIVCWYLFVISINLGLVVMRFRVGQSVALLFLLYYSLFCWRTVFLILVECRLRSWWCCNWFVSWMMMMMMNREWEEHFHHHLPHLDHHHRHPPLTAWIRFAIDCHHLLTVVGWLRRRM